MIKDRYRSFIRAGLLAFVPLLVTACQGGHANVPFFVGTGATAVLGGFVSPNGTSVTITVLAVNSVAPSASQVPVNPVIVPLSTGAGGNCVVAPTGETCTVALPAPSGSVQYQFQIKDNAAHILSRSTLTFTVVPGVASQSFSVPMNGVVSTVVVTKPTLTTGTAFSGPITVQAFDASGALIVGAQGYANPFTLTDNDATTHTSLTNGVVTAKTVTVNTPNDVVILNYDGAPDPPFTITATIPP